MGPTQPPIHSIDISSLFTFPRAFIAYTDTWPGLYNVRMTSVHVNDDSM
jgi:hypothetical protein